MGVRKTVAEVENIDYIGMAESPDIGNGYQQEDDCRQPYLPDDAGCRCEQRKNASPLPMPNEAEFTVKAGSKITKHPVKDLGLPKGTTIGGLIRNGEGVVVMGNTQIQPGDRGGILPEHDD